MSWILASILSAAIIGMAVIIDSHLISKRMSSLEAFLVPAGCLFLIFSFVINLIDPFPWDIGTAPLIASIASGIMRALGVYLMLSAMRSEEVSRIIPVTNTYPIFVAILAIPFLGESLGFQEWTAIFLTVAGAILISVQWDSQRQGAFLGKTFLRLILASLLMGAANTSSKYALDDMSFWNMYAINALCFTGVFFVTSLRPGILKEIWETKRRNATLALLAINECIALVGAVLSFWAMEHGPISLVSTILSTRPAFVFAYAVIMTLVFPAVLKERLTRGVVLTKTVSIALIIVGVTIINL